ncbi:hypothetical protein WJ91_03915 [Burkholderia ubonensis]|nr:hypothetical protein WJ91_03915 [Burkholderia ubonensis]KVP70991.1 hypothetical protein WJ93_13470 [Burkholderia ubonensis]KVV45624.1 hypothetical protein WK81_09860 [Burkholderia ubonensis]KWO78609.1 hypothetical protein WM31_31580 [Burkholderia ubonensis]
MRTMTAHITNLGKIQTKTEDEQLATLLGAVVNMLRQVHGNAVASKQKVKGLTTPGSLYDLANAEIKQLIHYCSALIPPKKPEWQVLAERHGWTPPQS